MPSFHVSMCFHVCFHIINTSLISNNYKQDLDYIKRV
jgi:hypothetical protein